MYLRPFASRSMALLLMLGVALAVGCATTDDTQSDIPWNAPEPWEGSPYIPGFGNQ